MIKINIDEISGRYFQTFLVIYIITFHFQCPPIQEQVVIVFEIP